MRRSPLLSGEVESRTEVMRRKLRNRKGGPRWDSPRRVTMYILSQPRVKSPARLTESGLFTRVPVPLGVSLLESDTPLIDVDDFARPAEPAIVRARNIIAWTLPSGRTLRCLVDSGSEVDLVDQDVVRTDPSFTTSRLTAPLHLRLGTRDKSDRCAVFANALFTSGSLDLGLRAFFICRVTAYDAILGLPFLKDTGMLVGWGVFTVARPGPSQPGRQGHSRVGSRSHDHWPRAAQPSTGCRRRPGARGFKYSDVFVDSLPMDRLPPYRPVNHEIPLIDPNEKVKPRVYPLPTNIVASGAEHSAKYTRGRFWVSGPIDSAAPVFAIPKKNSQTARFVIDLRARNSNTAKRFSPIPDMTSVRYEVARSRYRSKFDVAAAFEQVRVIPEHVDRTGFATVTGTYTSRPCLSFAKIFFDDVHIPWARSSPTTASEVDPAKWERIRQWPTPHNKTDVQRFLGTVNWMRDHLPHLSITLEPITALLAQSTSWRWNEREQQAFDTVKSLVPATLRPIDGAKVTSGEHKIYLFTDASRVGIGACLASGPTRSQAIPTRFFSAKFNGAQLNYHHLIGYPFVIVTDHQALRTIKTQKLRQTPRHIRMCLELSRFDFEFEFIAGKNNSLADSLSRLWEVKEGSPEDQVKENELEDMFFDGERHGFTTHGESLPEERPYTSPSPDRLPPVDFAFGPQRDDCEAGSPGYYALKDESQDEDVNGRDLGNLFLKEECHEFTTPGESSLRNVLTPHLRTIVDADADELDLLGAAADEVNDAPVVHRPPDPLPQPFLDAVIRAYAHDSQSPISFPVCASRSRYRRCRLRQSHRCELVLSEIHGRRARGHRITLAAIRPLYWWSSMSADCAKFCHSCEDCARGKASTQVPYGRLHPMPIPSGHGTSGHRLHDGTASGRVRRDDGRSNHGADADSELVADRYYATIFRLHGRLPPSFPIAIPSSPRSFGEHCRRSRTVLRMSTAAHPETDGSSENRIKMVTQTLRIMVSRLTVTSRRWPTIPGLFGRPACGSVARIRQLRNLDVTDAIIGARLDQTHQANKHRRPDDPAFRTGSYVYLSTKTCSSEGEVNVPRYIGPFRIRAAIPARPVTTSASPAMCECSRFQLDCFAPIENDAESSLA
ncbi:BZ3500_MvSof-1268-A1-R1_C072g00373 [Microbotryum saponariae]|uniref:BZ3500_MvSof-1268-A1-R1_C072g00373 protein n=1 Tax=Microbotryum saponariae TaxID=289078 RepID=A0A2X0KNK5_9BASI|nr:BZ3500_MvSof-1268-A1-R1_C072g00373 [Microbotryum saponariae]